VHATVNTAVCSAASPRVRSCQKSPSPPRSRRGPGCRLLSRSALADRFISYDRRAADAVPRQLAYAGRDPEARNTSTSLAQIAEFIGYDSEAAFCRAFKKAIGSAPAWGGSTPLKRCGLDLSEKFAMVGNTLLTKRGLKTTCAGTRTQGVPNRLSGKADPDDRFRPEASLPASTATGGELNGAIS
jgi:AraC-like DNA-binding protein